MKFLNSFIKTENTGTQGQSNEEDYILLNITIPDYSGIISYEEQDQNETSTNSGNGSVFFFDNKGLERMLENLKEKVTSIQDCVNSLQSAAIITLNEPGLDIARQAKEVIKEIVDTDFCVNMHNNRGTIPSHNSYLGISIPASTSRKSFSRTVSIRVPKAPIYGDLRDFLTLENLVEGRVVLIFLTDQFIYAQWFEKTIIDVDCEEAQPVKPALIWIYKLHALSNSDQPSVVYKKLFSTPQLQEKKLEGSNPQILSVPLLGTKKNKKQFFILDLEIKFLKNRNQEPIYSTGNLVFTPRFKSTKFEYPEGREFFSFKKLLKRQGRYECEMWFKNDSIGLDCVVYEGVRKESNDVTDKSNFVYKFKEKEMAVSGGN